MEGTSSKEDPHRGLSPVRRWVSRAMVIAAAAVLAVVLWSVWDHRAMMAWLRDAGPLPLFGAMALLPVFGLPLTPFFILAGATFGIGPGLLGCAVALGLNLVACYWIARSGLRPWVKSLLRRFSYELPEFDAQNHGNNQGAVRFTLAIKLAPGVPGFAKNYILGVAGVPFGLYFGLSMLITGAYAASFVVLGESLLQHNRTRALYAGAVAGVLALGVWWWRGRHGRDRARAPCPRKTSPQIQP